MAGPLVVIAAMQSANWIEVHVVSDSTEVFVLHASTQLGLGECAALILAEELGAHRVLVDDRAGRREATARGLPVTGTIGTLLVAKQQGIIASIKEVLDDLRAQGTRISDQLYLDALGAADE